MALEGTGSDADRVNVGSGTNLDQMLVGTFASWLWFDSISAGIIRQLWGKALAGNRKELRLQAGNLIQLTIARTAATNVSVAAASLPGLAAGQWAFLAVTWNTALTDADQHIYGGNLAKTVDEVATYTSQVVGSGTVGDDTGLDLQLLNSGDTVGPASSFDGRCAWMGFWRRQLSQQDLEQLRRVFIPQLTVPSIVPLIRGCVLWMPLGQSGANQLQRNYVQQGKNSGTVTGATYVSDHPLVTMPYYPRPHRDRFALHAVAVGSPLPPSLLVQQAVKRAAYW